MSRSSKYWCITCWDTNWGAINYESLKAEAERDGGSIQATVFQKESAPDTGKLHFQIYAQLKIKTTRGKMAEILQIQPNTYHAEIARGSSGENVVYCTKEYTRVEGPWILGTIKKKQQGHRSDLNAIAAAINVGIDLPTIARAYPGDWFRYYKGIKDYQVLTINPPEWRELDVTVYWGLTDVGKSRRVRIQEGTKNIYVLRKGNYDCIWFDGYLGQKVLLIDDFYGWIKISDLLVFLDGYPLQLQTKGSYTWAFWERVYLTSNVHPKDWYKDVPAEVIKALMRRIHIIEYMGSGDFDVDGPRPEVSGNTKDTSFNPLDYTPK